MEPPTKLLSHSYHILLVEDTQEEADKIKLGLEKLHQQKVIHFKTGEEALQFLQKKNRINIVLLDIQLSASEKGINGIELTKEIQKISPYLPILLITTHGNKYARSIAKLEVDWFSRYNENYLQGLVQKIAEVLNRPYIQIDNAYESIKVKREDIVYITTDNTPKNYIEITYLYGQELKEILLKKSLSVFIKEKELDNLIFASQSYYVNRKFVERIQRGMRSAKLILNVKKNVQIKVSREASKNF